MRGYILCLIKRPEVISMTKLYKKNELMFALVWIAIYVVGTSLAEALCEALGVVKLVPAAFHLALTVILLLWVRRNDLTEKCGLFLPRYRLSSAWFFLPLILNRGKQVFTKRILPIQITLTQSNLKVIIIWNRIF